MISVLKNNILNPEIINCFKFKSIISFIFKMGRQSFIIKLELNISNSYILRKIINFINGRIPSKLKICSQRFIKSDSLISLIYILYSIIIIHYISSLWFVHPNICFGFMHIRPKRFIRVWIIIIYSNGNYITCK